MTDAHADRVTTWTVEATNRVNAYLDWPHVGLVLRVETLTKRRGTAVRAVWYGVTSVTADRADARATESMVARPLGHREPTALRPRRDPG